MEDLFASYLNAYIKINICLYRHGYNISYRTLYYTLGYYLRTRVYYYKYTISVSFYHIQQDLSNDMTKQVYQNPLPIPRRLKKYFVPPRTTNILQPPLINFSLTSEIWHTQPTFAKNMTFLG